jgi:hypothetical protein
VIAEQSKDSFKDGWEEATFAGARAAQTREFAARPLIERLRWNCEMSEMIRLKHLLEGKTPPALNPNRYQ